jgi:hypothetical protein
LQGGKKKYAINPNNSTPKYFWVIKRTSGKQKIEPNERLNKDYSSTHHKQMNGIGRWAKMKCVTTLYSVSSAENTYSETRKQN